MGRFNDDGNIGEHMRFALRGDANRCPRYVGVNNCRVSDALTFVSMDLLTVPGQW